MASKTSFPSRFGKYILLDRINSGGMAEVYRAKVTGVQEFQRLVAIKCMLPNLLKDKQFTTMFIDEAKISSQLSHPNIVQIYELGSQDEQLYIAMELINGRDLRHVVRTAARHKIELPHGFGAYVVSKAAEGLDFAHRKTNLDGQPLNLVHRDVSPQNILIGYEGEVKVVDFGIAKAEERATETRAGVLKGKFSYMAPEQVMGQAIDRRADIFALGAVLFEILTQKKLFKGESDLEVLENVRAAKLPDLDTTVPGAVPELHDALRRAMAKKVDKRFQWASEFAEALEPVLIENRSIFGAKRARHFMQELYAAEIEELAAKNRTYVTITDNDCVNADSAPMDENHTQIFESAFGGTNTGPGPAAQPAAGSRPGVRPSSGPHSRPNAPVLSGETQELDAIGDGFFEEGRKATVAVPMEELPNTVLGDPVSAASSPAVGAAAPPRSGGPNPRLMLGLALGAVFLMLIAVIAAAVYKRSQKHSGGEAVMKELTPQNSGGLRPLNAPKGKLAQTALDANAALAPGTFGYVSIKAVGTRSATVFIDGKKAGRSPLVFHKLRHGSHSIRVVEDGGAGRSAEKSIEVSPSNTRQEPLRVLIPL